NQEIVRIDLQTRKETTIAKETNLIQMTPIPGSGKILLVAYEDDYSLLDLTTGAITALKGEGRPLAQQRERPLQPVAKSADYWAAIPDAKTNKTQVGRYDVRTFKFTPMLELPDIQFTSM